MGSLTSCPRCGFRALTVPEAATEMGVSDQTIRNWIFSGRLPTIQETIPGGYRYLIPMEALEGLRKDPAPAT